jgi:hypothetical protein
VGQIRRDQRELLQESGCIAASNPLDDAFAKVGAERAVGALAERRREQAAEAAIQVWLAEYRQILAGAPKHVRQAPEGITLAWSPEIEPPSAVRPAGTGRDHQGDPLAFGTCEAWRFARFDTKSESWTQFFISSDCAAIFEIERFGAVTVRRSLRRGTSTETLGPFVDLQTGRHTLRLSVSPGSGEQPSHIWGANMPSPEDVAKVIAEQESSRRR